MLKNLFNLCTLTLLLFTSVLVSSCSSDDDSSQSSECSQLSTQATVNGDDSFTLASAQRMINSGFEGTINMFQISAVSSDCNNVVILQIIVEVSGEIAGTYNVVDFFDANLNDAYGSMAFQDLANNSQSLVEIASGTLVIIDNGGNSLTIDFEGVLEDGSPSSFKTTHSF